MIHRYTYKDSVWVDAVNPTAEEIRSLTEEFSIHPKIADELTTPSIKSRVERMDESLYLILHFPAFRHTHLNEPKQEVDFIIGKKYLITARYETIDAIEKFAKEMEVKSILERGFGDHCDGFLFFSIIREMYQSIFDELGYIESWIGKIEDGIFNGKEKEMVFALSEVSRTLLNFKKATSFHNEALQSMELYGRSIFDEHFSYHVRRVLDEYSKVTEALSNNVSSLTELRETNNALLSSKQNEIMKILTIMAFVTFPLSLIASIFGMNTSFIPLVGVQNDFWIVMAIMAIATVGFFAYFKYKKWF
jgi:magnesium transporter